MNNPVYKIILTNWITGLGIILCWSIEVILGLNIKNLSVIQIIKNFLNSFFDFFSSGIFIIVPLLFVSIVIDNILVKYKDLYKYKWSIVILHWLIVSSPFIYWSLKSENNNAMNIMFIVMFFCVQCFRKRLINKLK